MRYVTLQTELLQSSLSRVRKLIDNKTGLSQMTEMARAFELETRLVEKLSVKLA
jgi:hypothetical protein